MLLAGGGLEYYETLRGIVCQGRVEGVRMTRYTASNLVYSTIMPPLLFGCLDLTSSRPHPGGFWRTVVDARESDPEYSIGNFGTP